MDSTSLIQDSLKILSFVCLNPFSQNLLNRIVGLCAALLVIGVLVDVSLVLSFTYQGIDSTMEVMSVVAATQFNIKVIFLLANKEELVILIDNTSLFWKPNPNDLKQQEENKNILSFVKFFIRFYILLLLLLCLLYLAKPLVSAEVTELPWKSCCSKIFKYHVCYMFEGLQILIVLCVISGFDTLYISLIATIICQFKLIEKRFPNLKINTMVHGTDKEAMDDLKELIEHHNLILRCTKIMKHVFRIPLLVLFLSSMFGMCFSMLIMISSITDNTTKIQFGMMLIFDIIELFFYCISGSLLADESVKISYEAYKSKWWIKTQPELRKTVIMVIRRSNHPEMLSAGGLLEVNLATFTMILKNSFSFFTFMQVIYGNS